MAHPTSFWVGHLDKGLIWNERVDKTKPFVPRDQGILARPSELKLKQ